MQPLSGNQRPDLLTALMNMSLVLRLPRKMHLCRSSSNVPRLPSFLEMLGDEWFSVPQRGGTCSTQWKRVFQQCKVWSSEGALSNMLPAAALQTYRTF